MITCNDNQSYTFYSVPIARSKNEDKDDKKLRKDTQKEERKVGKHHFSPILFLVMDYFILVAATSRKKGFKIGVQVRGSETREMPGEQCHSSSRTTLNTNHASINHHSS